MWTLLFMHNDARTRFLVWIKKNYTFNSFPLCGKYFMYTYVTRFVFTYSCSDGLMDWVWTPLSIRVYMKVYLCAHSVSEWVIMMLGLLFKIALHFRFQWKQVIKVCVLTANNIYTLLYSAIHALFVAFWHTVQWIMW